MVTPAERPHADATLKRLLSRVNADVSGEFVAAGEASVAVGDWTGVRALVDGGFAGAVRVFAGTDWDQTDWHGTLLIDLE